MKQQYEPTDFDKEDGFFEIPNKKYVAIVDKELTVVGKELTQSQAHGFTIENDIKEKVFELTEQNVNLVKSIPSGKNTNKTYLINKKELQQKHQMNLSINPKVDSKSQRRVQCKIPLKLFEQYPEYILYRNTEAIVRGVEITKTIQSSPRKRSKKEVKGL